MVANYESQECGEDIRQFEDSLHCCVRALPASQQLVHVVPDEVNTIGGVSRCFPRTTLPGGKRLPTRLPCVPASPN